MAGRFVAGDEEETVNELTLESLARRVEAIEELLQKGLPPAKPKNWRSAIGMLRGDDFSLQVDEEVRKIREADREAARQADTAECSCSTPIT
jgi:hypothetical protein